MTDTFNYFEGVSQAAKLLFPVPHHKGTLRLDHPIERASGYGQNNPGGIIAVWNYTERAAGLQGTWQGADAISGFVIMNTVPRSVAELLLGMLRELAIEQARKEHPIAAAAMDTYGRWADGREMMIEEAASKFIYSQPYQIHHLRTVVGEAYLNGVGDIYTTNEEWVREHLSPAGPMLGNLTGVMKRDARDVCHFYRTKDGTFYVRNDGKTFKVITPDDLVRSYRTKEGGKIDLDMIPVIDAEQLY